MTHKTHLKIRFVQQVPMSKQGYKGWSPNRRARLHKFVYKPVAYLHVPVERLKNKEEIGKLCSEELTDGIYYCMGYSHGKTRTHVKLVPLFKIRLRIGNEGKYQCTILRNFRLFRYWFWSG